MEIKDLILPETFNKKETLIKLLDKKYSRQFQGLISEGALRYNNYARDYVKALDEIENIEPVYNQEYCKEVNKLNTANFQKIGIYLSVYAQYCRFINPKDDYSCSISFEFNELELINKQYRLLQEIYYSRLSK